MAAVSARHKLQLSSSRLLIPCLTCTSPLPGLTCAGGLHGACSVFVVALLAAGYLVAQVTAAGGRKAG
jgi:hypothetical protein